ANGPAVEVRLAERLPDDSWLVLLVCQGGEPFECGLRAGLALEFGPGLAATVLERDRNIPRLWRARFSAAGGGFFYLGHRAGRGYTRLRVTADHRLRAADGLLTGLHEPEASHLDLLTAFLPAGLIRSAYEEAVDRGYLWHEFGDLNLIV